MTAATLPEQLELARWSSPEHAARIAVQAGHASLTYGQFEAAAHNWAFALLEQGLAKPGQRIALLLPPGPIWAVGMRAVWLTGAAAVPLCLSHPLPEWEHVLEDAQCTLLLADPMFLPRLQHLSARGSLHVRSTRQLFERATVDSGTTDSDECDQDGKAALLAQLQVQLPLELPVKLPVKLTVELPAQLSSQLPAQSPLQLTTLSPDTAQPFARVKPDDVAQLVYTSGSTGKPKGAVITHGQLAAQIQALVHSWAWTTDDIIINVLPLHHVHGMVNVYCCALWSGATVIELGGFDACKVWEALLLHRPTLFMAVPTVYQKLADAYHATDIETRLRWSGACAFARLMVSGSAALSPALLERWQAISGHVLLERYGMTEIGMALSNPLHGVRVPGSVGFPLPTVACRLTNEAGTIVEGEGSGELQVNGPSVFRAYWNKPEASAAAFDGLWFRTGDLAKRDSNGGYRILGRLSVDLIKTGGFKVAAPEIEETLLEHPAISECAVVGVPDPLWGQQVAAALVLRPGHALTLEGLRAWTRERLAVYKVPGRMMVMETLPRNAMGKVIKPDLVALFNANEGEPDRWETPSF